MIRRALRSSPPGRHRPHRRRGEHPDAHSGAPRWEATSRRARGDGAAGARARNRAHQRPDARPRQLRRAARPLRCDGRADRDRRLRHGLLVAVAAYPAADDTLKIDRSFVQQLGIARENATVKAIIGWRAVSRGRRRRGRRDEAVRPPARRRLPSFRGYLFRGRGPPAGTRRWNSRCALRAGHGTVQVAGTL